MKKLIPIFSVLLCVNTLFAQKPVIQQATYAGVGNIKYASMGYEARFRHFYKKPDFSLGMGLTAGSEFGLRPSASVLGGRGSHAFEVGVNSTFIFNTYTFDQKFLNANQTNFFLGYRLQPKNHRFFLQAQMAPVRIYKNFAFRQISYNTYEEGPTEVISIFDKNNNTFFLNYCELRLGINLNRLQDTTAENSAYEAPKARKLPLQHAFTGELINSGFNGGLALKLGYDLRWRRPKGVDFAGNFSWGISGNFSYINPEIQGLALFGEKKVCFETGLSFTYSQFNNYYANGTIYEYLRLGLPIGVRYQPANGFFMRMYATPTKIFSIISIIRVCN